MLELNLIREKIVVLKSTKKFTRLLRYTLIVGGALFLLQLVYLSYIMYQGFGCRREIAAFKADIDRNKNLFEVDRHEKEWLKYLGELQSINVVLVNRTYLSARVNELTALLTPGVSIDGVEVDNSGDAGRMNVTLVRMVEPGQDATFAATLKEALAKNVFFGGQTEVKPAKKGKINNKDVEYVTVSVPLRKE